jgi:CheY-like chemotaxis protein
MNLPYRPDISRQSQQLRELAEEARREYDGFAGLVSHELHSVLHGVAGFTGALREHAAAALDAQGLHLLQRAEENAQRGLRMLEALIAYDQAVARRIERHPVDTRQALERAWRAASSALPQGEAGCSFTGIFPEVAGDALLLSRAFEQVFSNSVRFRRDDLPLHVQVVGALAGDALELRIEDNGIGFDAAESHRLFQPFVRLHPGHSREGVGMGLALVRRIVEAHGGSILAEGSGAGAAIVLQLALHRPAQAPQGALPPDAVRVLLIDDDHLVLGSITAMLERSGHQVTAVSGGVRGLRAFDQALRSRAFDVVVTDWGMPQVGGGRVAEAVKKASPSTPILVVTGQPGVPEQAAALGVDLVIQKPLRLEQLRTAISQLAPRARSGDGDLQIPHD